MFIVADASIWIARLVSEDVFYQPVKDWMSARLAQEDRSLAPALALRAIEQVQSLPGLQMIEMEASLVHEAAHFAAEFGLHAADSTSIPHSRKLDPPEEGDDSNFHPNLPKEV